MIRTPSASYSIQIRVKIVSKPGMLGRVPLPSAKHEEIKVPEWVSNNVREAVIQTGMARLEHGYFPFYRVE
jgi:hypothetical protein